MIDPFAGNAMSDKTTNSDKTLHADISLNSEVAERNPEIIAFIDIVMPKMIDRCVPFDFLQSSEIMPYWHRMVITRFEKDVQNFRHIFVGTLVTEAYGSEFTGNLLGDNPEDKEGTRTLLEIRNDVMDTRKIIYFDGKVLRKDYSDKFWDSAIMPYAISDNGDPVGTVSILSYYQ